MMPTQLEQLYKPINPARVKTAQGVYGSFLESWDVIAHLSRIFGIANWGYEVKETHLIFETEDAGKWQVCYGATGALTINDVLFTRYEDVGTGTSKQPSRGDAHDMAVKTAVSEALKRCARNLGNQFGLSLYDNGSVESVLGRSLADPAL